MAIRDAGDQQEEADTSRGKCQRRESGHALETVARPFAVHGHEVIEPPGSVEAECFGKLSSIDDFIEFESLLANVESKAHETHSNTAVPCYPPCSVQQVP